MSWSSSTGPACGVSWAGSQLVLHSRRVWQTHAQCTGCLPRTYLGYLSAAAVHHRSIVSECLAHSRPLVFVRRDFFNEEPFLRKKLEVHNAAIEMKRRDFLEGHWGPYLLRACSLTVRYK